MLLRCENLSPPMSQMGHSRRSDGQQGFAECPLCLQSRPNLCVRQRTDAMCQFPDLCTAANSTSLDHLVGEGK